jgi:hypothetical protein
VIHPVYVVISDLSFPEVLEKELIFLQPCQMHGKKFRPLKVNGTASERSYKKERRNDRIS